MTGLIIYIESALRERIPVMKKYLIVTVLIGIFLSACSQWISVNPLSSPSELDKKLEGVWRLDSKDGEVVYLHIGKKKENTMIALSVEHKDDGSLDIVEIPFFITRAGANKYFNLRYEDIDKDIAGKDKGYIFVKYSFADDNTLSFYQFDPDIIKSAVQSGRLKGEVYYKKSKTAPPPESAEKEKSTPDKIIDSVKITDTSENMVKFFQSEGNKFLPEGMKFIRVK